MAINFMDFTPGWAQVQTPLGPAPQYEGVKPLMERASRWIEQGGIDVINIETLVLPNPLRSEETESGLALYRENEGSTVWFQVVRVWYRVG